MKEIIVFTGGDSNDISTWSNVPFLFTKTLEKKGYIIHRIDTSPSKLINRMFNSLSFYLLRKILKLNACPEFHRTVFHRLIVYRRIKKATKLYKNILFNLFLEYDFYNKYSDKPNVLWSDWTDRIVIQRFGREPKWYELGSLKHEDNVVKSADLVFSLFPKVAKDMSIYYGREFVCLGKNVVNTVCDEKWSLMDIIENRKKSNKILFVGNTRYFGAAQELIKAYHSLKIKNDSLELHIVGMTKEQLNVKLNDIFCYGYLNKGVKEERDLYYSLLLSCKVFVNPAKVWGGYSSTVEAMYYGSPIVVAPYDDFVEEFGRDIKFGKYFEDGVSLEGIIESVLVDNNYDSLCVEAHNLVKDYTWDSYVDSFLFFLKEKGVVD